MKATILIAATAVALALLVHAQTKPDPAKIGADLIAGAALK